MTSSDGFDVLTGEPSGLRIRLLGGFQVWVGSHLIPEEAWKRRKVQALIELLALDPRHRLHREQLMDTLWPEAGIEAARNSLRQALHLARRIIEMEPNGGCHYLCDHNHWLVLSPEGQAWVDVDAFEMAAREARRVRKPAAYQAALALYAGELLPEDRYEDWVGPQREALRLLHLGLLSELGVLLEARGEVEQATEVYRQMVAVDPTEEAAHQALMRLYAATGQRNKALQQYRRLYEILWQELGVEPDSVSQRLYEEISSSRIQIRLTALTHPLARPASGFRLAQARRNGSNHP